MKHTVIRQIYNLKTWTLCAALSALTNMALARPSMSDVYDDSGGFEFWIVLFAVGWVIKNLFNIKSMDSMAIGLLLLVALVGIFVVGGFGVAFIGFADKHPLLAIAIAAFYWWAWKRDKKQK